MADKLVSNVFGTLGAVCWSIQLMPQIIMNTRRHSAKGLSTNFMCLWSAAGVCLGSYNIVSNLSIALQMQAQILSCLSLVTMGQCLYYEHGWSLKKVSIIVVVAMIVSGSIEYSLVYALRIAIRNGIDWPRLLMSSLAAILLVTGVLEQYVAIFKNKSTDGISFLFCGLDALGDITSIISVYYEAHLDIAGLAIYSAELLFWVGIFLLGFYFRWFPKWRQSVRIARDVIRSQPEHDLGRLHLGTGLNQQIEHYSTSVFQIARTSHQLRTRETGA